MDTEKKDTTTPQGKSGKRRKKKPASRPVKAADSAAAQGKPADKGAEKEKKPVQAAAETRDAAADTAAAVEPESPEQASGKSSGEKAQAEERSSTPPAETKKTPPEEIVQEAPCEMEPPETTVESAQSTEGGESEKNPDSQKENSQAVPGSEAAAEDLPLKEAPAFQEEEPLPDGRAVSEEDLSDALDRMLGGQPAEGKTPADEQNSPTVPEPDEPDAPDESDESEKPVEEKPPENADEQEPSEEEEKRLSDLTRTVQLSVEQIMARMEESSGEEHTEPQEEEEPPATLGDHVRNGVSGMCKWLLLVLFFVLVIAGGGVAWLYRSATPDMVPQISVSFAGQAVEPAAYKWKVPVVGNLFKRTYAETFYSAPVELAEPVEQLSPDVQISPSEYRSVLTVSDRQGEVVFEGEAEEFSSFQFDANDEYTAKLVVYVDQSTVSGAADVSGSETWWFTFSLEVRASVHLNSTTVDQGGVAAIRVGSTLDGKAPVIQTELENSGFFQAGTGWVCYLPVAWNQPAQEYEIQVSMSGHSETMQLKVRAVEWEYKDYSRDSQRARPYIGEADMPAEVKSLLADSAPEIAWANSNFVQPFLRSLKVSLAYGTTEYVGRSYSERSSNSGAGGRTAVNTILSTTRGELLIAPASGTVVLAKDLGGDCGNTLVIDHGAGVKSIFYGLDELMVKTGASVKQGQTLASCAQTTVAEFRIGTVAVDPLPIWRGQCDALKYY